MYRSVNAFDLMFDGNCIAKGIIAERNPIRIKYIMPREYKWSKYRDDDPVTTAGKELNIDIWLAGKDVECRIIGFSASDEKMCYMNTLFIIPNGSSILVQIIP